jgi:hypothetical protein
MSLAEFPASSAKAADRIQGVRRNIAAAAALAHRVAVKAAAPDLMVSLPT